MIERFTLWFRGRSEREQQLLAVMFALFAIVFFWLGVARPIAAYHDQSKIRLQTATAAHIASTSNLVALTTLEGQEPAPLGQPLGSFVVVSAAEAGFVLTPGEGKPSHVSIAAAKPIALSNWLDSLSARGIFLMEGSIRANSDATVAFEAVLAQRPQ
jgi:type II secretory pathway component PulM